ncbi:MAG: serine acetyltransferase [Bacillus sp. (in: firmicutes)]
MNAFKLYKIERWLYLKKVPLLPKIIKGIIYLLHNSSIPYECQMGKNCKFLYGGIGCVISKDTIIGDHVVIGTNVLIGGRSNKVGHPKIGNNVYIATGAKILGDIVISDNVIIGANAVVIKNVPSNCSVGGVPAKILKSNIEVEEYCSLDRYGKSSN